MSNVIRSKRAWIFATALLLGTASLAFAQFGGTSGGVPRSPQLEFTQQEVQAEALVKTCNDLSKDGWDVFQVLPIWKILNQNGENELVPTRFQILGRRPLAAK